MKNDSQDVEQVPEEILEIDDAGAVHATDASSDSAGPEAKLAKELASELSNTESPPTEARLKEILSAVQEFESVALAAEVLNAATATGIANLLVTLCPEPLMQRLTQYVDEQQKEQQKQAESSENEQEPEKADPEV